MEMGGWHLVSFFFKQIFSSGLWLQLHYAFLNFPITGIGTDKTAPLGDKDDTRLGAPTACFKVIFHELAWDFLCIGETAVSRTVKSCSKRKGHLRTEHVLKTTRFFPPFLPSTLRRHRTQKGCFPPLPAFDGISLLHSPQG